LKIIETDIQNAVYEFPYRTEDEIKERFDEVLMSLKTEGVSMGPWSNSEVRQKKKKKKKKEKKKHRATCHPDIEFSRTFKLYY
jgi:hypothetical protein